MNRFIFKLLISGFLGLIQLTSSALASGNSDLTLWPEQLTPTEALGRFEWLAKCHSGLLVETWEQLYDVTQTIPHENKIQQLKALWLYDEGQLKPIAHYPIFAEKDHSNPKHWFPENNPEATCKSIPPSYRIVGLRSAYDIPHYCPVTASRFDSNAILQVRFLRAGLDDQINISDARAYSNFSGRVIYFERGNNIKVSVKESQIHPRLKGFWHVFADWNQNGKLDDAGEMVLDYTETETDELSFYMTVPSNAQPGYTRLRIVNDYAGGSRDPCRNIQIGEIEDYTLYIQ